MKKYIIALSAVLLSIGQAEEITKNYPCTETKRLFNWIGEEYEEKLFIVFQQDNSKEAIALTINTETKTWTLVEYNSKKGCMIGSGSDYRINIRNTAPRSNS